MTVRKQKKILIQEELERSILHGLACTWDTALWVLTPLQSNLMQRPLFRLGDLKGKWGFWSGERREICLSRNLVLHHRWDTVREVLLHEMAHQFAQEVLGSCNETPHGPKFQKACYLLRANPKASENYVPLDEKLFHESAGSRDKIILRVKKLMSLAQSQNRHEAEAAMAKAYSLIGKYNLDMMGSDEGRDFFSVFAGQPALRHFREHYYLARLLQDFYFVQGLWVPAYVLEKGKMGNVLEITGTLQNLRLAGYVYDFIWHFIDSQWHMYNQDNKLSRSLRTDFSVGILEGFRSKLESHKKASKNDEHLVGLIKIEDPLLLKHIAYKYPHTTTVRRRASRQDKKALYDGINVGKSLVIAKGIEQKVKGNQLLIGNKKSGHIQKIT
jgi:hypothetical protein